MWQRLSTYTYPLKQVFLFMLMAIVCYNSLPALARLQTPCLKADTKSFCYKELLLQVHFFLNTWHRGGLVWLTCHQYGIQDHAQTANQISSY